MSRKWKSSILGHFKIKCIWAHVKNTSFTCFLGHFMIPRVFHNSRQLTPLSIGVQKSVNKQQMTSQGIFVYCKRYRIDAIYQTSAVRRRPGSSNSLLTSFNPGRRRWTKTGMSATTKRSATRDLKFRDGEDVDALKSPKFGNSSRKLLKNYRANNFISIEPSLWTRLVANPMIYVSRGLL